MTTETIRECKTCAHWRPQADYVNWPIGECVSPNLKCDGVPVVMGGMAIANQSPGSPAKLLTGPLHGCPMYSAKFEQYPYRCPVDGLSCVAEERCVGAGQCDVYRCSGYFGPPIKKLKLIPPATACRTSLDIGLMINRSEQ